MRFASVIPAAVLTLLLMTVPAASAAPAPLDDPVLNGDFEQLPTRGVANPLEDTPADTCVGVGHQVFYGTDSPQHDAANAADHGSDAVAKASNGDVDGAEESLAAASADAEKAADHFDPDSARENATEQAGVGHCVHSNEEGKDVAWIQTVRTLERAQFWSTALAESPSEWGYGFDGDPFDREVRVAANASASNHVFWQSFAAKQQAYSLNFTRFRFDVERGAVASAANIQLGFSLSPGYVQHPFVGVFWEGALMFTAADMTPDADGTVTLDPIRDGEIICPDYDPCRRFKTAYEAADDAGKRRLLGQTRLVQNSFWNFNRGESPIVVDDVRIDGATLAVEEIASGNANPNPQLPDDTFEPEPASQDNDVVMMIHGASEPTPPAGPPANEAFYATNDNGTVELLVIPYAPNATGTWVPLNLSDAAPTLRIEAVGQPDLVREPNVPADQRSRCEDETTIHGHRGPIEACLVFSLPAERFAGRNVVALTLSWDGGVEVYNNVAHVLLHSSFEGAPVTVDQADELTLQPTPFVVESQVDPVS